ncbi:MAG: hypothetical protein DWI00_15265, partial [Planctomycetota bacterium]
ARKSRTMEAQTSKSRILFVHKKTAIQVPFNSAEQRNTKTIQIDLAVSAGRTQASIGGSSFSSHVACNDAEVLGQPEHQRRSTTARVLASRRWRPVIAHVILHGQFAEP